MATKSLLIFCKFCFGVNSRPGRGRSKCRRRAVSQVAEGEKPGKFAAFGGKGEEATREFPGRGKSECRRRAVGLTELSQCAIIKKMILTPKYCIAVKDSVFDRILKGAFVEKGSVFVKH